MRERPEGLSDISWVRLNQEEAADLYQNKNWTVAQIAKKYKVSRDTMKNVLNGEMHLSKKGHLEVLDKDREKITRWFLKSTYTVQEMADMYGITWEQMYHTILRRWKVKKNTTNRRLKEIDDLIAWEYQEGETIKELAKAYEASEEAIRTVIRRYDVRRKRK